MRALVVDESSLQRRFITWLLREFRDLEVVEAADSVTALNLLITQEFNVVLMEIKMPGMDGLTLLTKLRSTPTAHEKTAFIVVSTLSDETTRSRAKALGVAEFLTKPVPAVRVRDVVRDQLKQPVPAIATEKRQAPRLRVAATVRFTGEEPLELSTADISPSGAFLVTDQLKNVGDVGALTIVLPHVDKPLTVEFRVIHVRSQGTADQPAGFGVRFNENSEELARLARAFEMP